MRKESDVGSVHFRVLLKSTYNGNCVLSVYFLVLCFLPLNCTLSAIKLKRIIFLIYIKCC